MTFNDMGKLGMTFAEWGEPGTFDEVAEMSPEEAERRLNEMRQTKRVESEGA